MLVVATPFSAVDPGRADAHVDLGRVVEDPVEEVVVVADGGSHPHDQLDVGAALVRLIERLGVPPDRIAAASLEDAERVRRRDRLALVVAERRRTETLAVAGQSTPGLSGVAIVPAPYSPVSKYVREYQP